MVGIDEVGRGCLAGPLLIVAARQVGGLPPGLADSKLLDRQKREELFLPLVASCRFGEGWVKPVEIDQRGLTGAMRLGIKRALGQLKVSYSEEIIMDGPVNYCSRRYLRVHCEIAADAKVPIVSAASVYAKVRRDRFMAELAKRHPKYGFELNVGYGTRPHLQALSEFGYLKTVHRQLFSPVRMIGRIKQ